MEWLEIDYSRPFPTDCHRRNAMNEKRELTPAPSGQRELNGKPCATTESWMLSTAFGPRGPAKCQRSTLSAACAKRVPLGAWGLLSDPKLGHEHEISDAPDGSNNYPSAS